MIFENITNRIRQAFGIPLHSTNVLEEMARVGYMSPKFEVYVYTDDPGYIPHVHVRDTNSILKLEQTYLFIINFLFQPTTVF